MVILELHLKHFGKFKDYRLSLKPGMNIIYGKNDTGKSTIHSFIRAMFYGYPKNRGRAAAAEEYQLHQPWECPSFYEGSMRVQKNGEIFRIERNFDREHASLHLFNESTGREVTEPETGIAYLLEDMTETAFCNTIFLAQGKEKTEPVLFQELKSFLAQETGETDSQIDITGALKLLNKKKKQQEQEKKKQEAQLEEQINRRQTEADYVRKELENLRLQKDQHTRMEKRPERQQEIEEQKEKKPFVLKSILTILLLLISGACFSGSWLWKEARGRVLLAAFGILFLLMLFIVWWLLRNSPTVLEAELSFGEEDSTRQWKEQNLQEELLKKEDTYRRLQQELEILYADQVGMEKMDVEIEALELAMDRIDHLAAALLQGSQGNALEKNASQHLQDMTGGKYQKLYLEENGEIRIGSGERILYLYQCSYATALQIHLALRIAAGEILSRGGCLPFLLDDPFSAYDDQRLANILRILEQSGRQVILFTSSQRERRLSQPIGE